GTIELLVRGTDISINSRINGLHLVSRATPVGNVILPAGALLMTLDADDDSVGTTSLSPNREDIFFLVATSTSLAGTAAASAHAFLDGAAVGIPGERFDALSIHVSNN